MLRVHIRDNVAPAEHRKGHFSNSRVNRLGVLSVPNDQHVVLPDSCEETTIRAELQEFHTVHHAFKHSERFPRFIVPQDNGGFRSSLELRPKLSSS